MSIHTDASIDQLRPRHPVIPTSCGQAVMPIHLQHAQLNGMWPNRIHKPGDGLLIQGTGCIASVATDISYHTCLVHIGSGVTSRVAGVVSSSVLYPCSLVPGCFLALTVGRFRVYTTSEVTG